MPSKDVEPGMQLGTNSAAVPGRLQRETAAVSGRKKPRATLELEGDWSRRLCGRPGLPLSSTIYRKFNTLFSKSFVGLALF